MRADLADPALLRRALRFGASGLLMTALHAAIVTALIETLLPSAALANGVAFTVATVASYLVNTTWSFSSPLRGRNLVRFCLVSTACLALAMGISGAAQLNGLSYWHGIGLVIAVVTPASFLLHNFWTYR